MPKFITKYGIGDVVVCGPVVSVIEKIVITEAGVSYRTSLDFPYNEEELSLLMTAQQVLEHIKLKKGK